MIRSEGRLNALETVVQSAGRILVHWHEEMELLSCMEALLLEEEKGEEETQEEFEERMLNKRASHLNKILSSKLDEADSVVRLTDMTRRNNRKQVAQKFYSLLVLQKVMAVNLTQSECYGELSVMRGPKFESAML